MIKNISKRITIILGLTLVFFVLLGVILYFLFYFSPINRAKLKFLGLLPLPIAQVDKEFVYSKDMVYYEKVYTNTTSNKLDEKAVFEKILNNKKTEVLAKNLNLIATPAQIDFFYNQLSKDEKNIRVLNSYSANSNEFKIKFLKFFITENNLKIWFNQQESFHSQEYAFAKNLQSQAFDSDAFSRLALKFSQDKSSNIFGGDAGMKETGELLPEISDALAKLKNNQTTIVASSAGLHLLRLEGKDLGGHEGSQRYGFKQIFLPLHGFEEWLDSARQPINTKIFIKF